MKLMIVEDETVTREGLLHLANWEEIGIEEIFTAENGERGLMAAKLHKPDIVLTDIRMPRMNGIVMGEKIREILPGCQIIFLSAYEEIDYYKAAIKLKAVSYVEKPVSREEVIKVVKEAIYHCKMHARLENAAQADGKRQIQEIALKMTLPNQKIDELMNRKCLFVTTVLVWFSYDGKDSDELLKEMEERLEPVIKAMKLEMMGARKNHNCLLFHILSQNKSISGPCWSSIFNEIREAMDGTEIYYVTVGKTVAGCQKAFQSYQSAVILLQKSFYEAYGTILKYESEKQENLQGKTHQKEKEELLHMIEELQREGILETEQKLYEKLKAAKNIMSQTVRSMYLSFFFYIDRRREIAHINQDIEIMQESWMKQMEIANLDSLHKLFLEKMESLFEKLDEAKGEQSVILQVKEYIGQNYDDPLLSLKDISEYVHMSNSHMCTIFKKKTSVTINQYLTDIRMEKSKYYLKNSNYSITEISQMVGYKDSSYFGRIFKKTFDQTPVEYRIQCKEIK